MPTFVFNEVSDPAQDHAQGVALVVNFFADIFGAERNERYDQQPRHVSSGVVLPGPSPVASALEQQARSSDGRDAPAQGQGALRLEMERSDP